jgi:hypothetical protein
MKVDFNALEAEFTAAVPPLVAERDALIRRVHEGVAEYVAANPSTHVTTAPNEELDAAVLRFDARIAATKKQIYVRHADALRATRADEARAVAEAGRVFLAAFSRFQQFEARRASFELACRVPSAPTFAPEDTGRQLEAWVNQVERAIAPRRQPAQVPRVPLAERIRQLVGV